MTRKKEMTMLTRVYAICMMSLLTLTATAQRSRQHSVSARANAARIVAAYTDSLRSLRERLDTTTNVKADDAACMYKLFLPPTFYHSAINGRFAIGDVAGNATADRADSALMYIYMRRPDLVTNSERQLRKHGELRHDVDQPVKTVVDFDDRLDMLPDNEPDIAPVGVVIQRPRLWTYSGDGYLQFLQNYISDNWYKGGESNYSMVGSVTLNANYNNHNHLKFDNKLELQLGFQTSRSDTLHTFKTTNDLIRYTGKLGLQASKQWYYSLQLLAYTQFARGLKSNDETVYSDFMSPFNLNVGIGMDYTVEAFHKRLKGNVNLAPFSFNFRYVDRLAVAENYGISEGHHTLKDFGSQVTADLTWTFNDIVSWKTRFYFYTTYKRTEIEWENTINIAVSRFISANLFLYPRFDDASTRDEKLGYYQFKEYSSLGFSYSF